MKDIYVDVARGQYGTIRYPKGGGGVAAPGVGEAGIWWSMFGWGSSWGDGSLR